MKNWTCVIFLMILSFTAVFGQSTKIVNGYKVVKGERPVIDLSKVPADAYYPGRISIKLKPEMDKFIHDDVILTKSKDGILHTGVESIDKLNSMFGAEKMKPHIYDLYNISPASVEHREKHKAWGFHLWMEITLPQDADVIQAVREYMALDEVEFAEPYYIDKLYEPVSKSAYTPSVPFEYGNDPKLTVNDTRFSEQWHYNNTGQNGGTVDCDIDLPEAWDIERGNNQVIVAVQDMGLQIDHPDLAGNIWSGIGYDFQANNATIEAGDHGCHTGGTISAVTNNNIGVSGIAGGTGSGDGVRLMSVQVYAADGSGGGNTDLPYIYSADNGAAISQNSWGYTSVDYYVQSVLDGIDYFNANGGGTVLDGGLTIFAAGNSNATGNWWPGCYSGAMAVAATTYQDIRASYSNYGSWVEVSAPGGQQSTSTDPKGVLSCISGSTYAFYQGTSMACPHTSGVAALIVSLAPGVFSNQEVRDIIKNTTDPIDALNPTYAGLLGTGRINAYAALQSAQDLTSGVLNPKTLSSVASSTTQIDLSWTKNDDNNSVMVIWSATGTFGTPVNGTSYSVGNTIPGGGTVLYRSTGTTYSHTGLTASTSYYYKAFSYTNQNDYSSGKTSNAMTLMNPLTPSAASLGFENSGSIPLGWTQEGNWTFVTTATRPTAPSEGSYFANFSTVSSTKKIVTPRFDLTTHTGVTINFDYFVGGRKVGPTTYTDILKVYYKTSLAGSWFLLGTYTGVTTNSTWLTATLNISDAVRTNDFYFAFEAVEGTTIGYGVSVDDIVINGTSGSAPPAVPTLALPANASLSTDLTPTFDWNDVSGATSYTIQIDDAAAFTSVNYTNSPTVSTYTPAADLPVGTWYWRVLATNAFGSSTYTSGWSVILGSAPGVPTLATPTNGSSTADLTPTFDWNDVSGATSYTIQIDDAAAFTSINYTNSPTTSTYTPAANLAVGTWYWRVLATNAFGSSTYTSGWSVILGSAPAAPSLAAPTDASTLYILKPVFDWNDVSGATSYTILVDNNSDFSSAEINQTPTASTYTPAADMAVGTYYWKVLSTNSFGSSSYSGTWSVILAPLSAPINVITTPGATDVTVSWSAVSGAASYDVYSSTDPYGTFTFVTNVATTSYLYTPASETKLFWYVIAKN